MKVRKPEASFAERVTVICLLSLLVALCCLSLVEVSKRLDYIPFHTFHTACLLKATVVVAAFSCVAIALFTAARFSFGYVTGLGLFTMMAGFLWINTFSRFPYDHQLARFSAMASFLLFLALAIVTPFRFTPRFEMSERASGALLLSIDPLALVTLLAASRYNFRIVSLA